MERAVTPLTDNGIHLNEAGDTIVGGSPDGGARLHARRPPTAATGPRLRQLEALRAEIRDKNQQFFYRWRPLNAEYVVGRRVEPFGSVSFPPEMRQLDEILTDLDNRIWKRARAHRPDARFRRRRVRRAAPRQTAAPRRRRSTAGHQAGQTGSDRASRAACGDRRRSVVASLAGLSPPACRPLQATPRSGRARSAPSPTAAAPSTSASTDIKVAHRSDEAGRGLRDQPVRLREGVPGDRQPARDDLRHARPALGAHLADLSARAARRPAARQAGDPRRRQSGRPGGQADGLRRRAVHPDRLRAGRRRRLRVAAAEPGVPARHQRRRQGRRARASCCTASAPRTATTRFTRSPGDRAATCISRKAPSCTRRSRRRTARCGSKKPACSATSRGPRS